MLAELSFLGGVETKEARPRLETKAGAISLESRQERAECRRHFVDISGKWEKVAVLRVDLAPRIADSGL